MDKTAIRNAASVIVLRDRRGEPSVLMGQRGAKAAFMPKKFVFPGGALDNEDFDVPLAATMADSCRGQMAEKTAAEVVEALPVAAIRELWEETGLMLGSPGTWPDPPADWAAFARAGLIPSAAALRFVFRAITPPGRPRRFDARFFAVDAEDLAGDIDDFSAASDELSHLQWIPLDQARSFDLPFITEVVLAEVTRNLDRPAPPDRVPFFENNEEESILRWLGRSE